MNSILLVQPGVTAATHPVSGRSGKLYGQSVFSPQHNAVIFRMSIDQYRDHSADLIGNTMPGQQWIPEIVTDETAAALPQSQPAAPPAPVRKEEKPDVQQAIHDGSQADVPLTRMPAPVIGTPGELGSGQPPVTVGQPAPKPVQPATIPVVPPVETGSNEPTPMLNRAGVESLIPQAKSSLPPAVKLVVDAVAERVVADLKPLLEKLAAQHKNGAKPKGKQVKETEFTALQRQAKILGVNIYGMSKDRLKVAIAEKTAT